MKWFQKLVYEVKGIWNFVHAYFTWQEEDTEFFGPRPNFFRACYNAWKNSKKTK